MTTRPPTRGTGARLLAGLLCVGLSFAATGADRTAAETRLKASFVYKFTLFVTWPEHSLGPPGTPLRFCVLGSSDFAQELRSIAQGRQAHGRTLETLHVPTEAGPASCHVLFVDQQSDSDVDALLLHLHKQSVLTIGESQHFLDHGGMIALLKHGQQMRFKVNRQSFEKSGLVVSSQLLRLASGEGD